MSPTLDPRLFDQLKELETGAPGFLKDLVSQFLNQAVGQIAVLHETTRAKDGEGLRLAAHRFKGAAGALAALALMELVAELEKAGSARSWTAAEELLPRVDAEFVRVKAALEASVA